MRWIIVLLLVLVACGTSKLAYQEDVKDRLSLFFVANQEKDYETMADMLYPKLFQLSSKEQMMDAFAQLEQDLDYSMKDMAIDSMSEAFVYEDTQYVLVKYHYTMTMRFLDESFHEPQMETQLLESFQNQYEEVSLSNHTFTFPLKTQLIAATPTQSKEWLFLEIKEDQEGLWQQLLPGEVVDHLGLSAGLPAAE